MKGKGDEEATENMSSYFKNVACKGEVRSRRKSVEQGREKS